MNRVDARRWGRAQERERFFWEEDWKREHDHLKEAASIYWGTHRANLESAVTLGPGTRLLEIGCGASPFIDHIPTGKRFVLDPLMRFYSSSFGLSDGIAGVRGVGEALPFPEESFDVVITTNTLDHVREPSCFLAEVRRVLRKDGVLYLTVDCHNALVKGYRDLKEGLGRGDACHPFCFTASEARRTVEASGLRIVSAREGSGSLGKHVYDILVPNGGDARRKGITARLDALLTMILARGGDLISQGRDDMDLIVLAVK